VEESYTSRNAGAGGVGTMKIRALLGSTILLREGGNGGSPHHQSNISLFEAGTSPRIKEDRGGYFNEDGGATILSRVR
jgi:hypothetical protein